MLRITLFFYNQNGYDCQGCCHDSTRTGELEVSSELGLLIDQTLQFLPEKTKDDKLPMGLNIEDLARLPKSDELSQVIEKIEELAFHEAVTSCIEDFPDAYAETARMTLIGLLDENIFNQNQFNFSKTLEEWTKEHNLDFDPNEEIYESAYFSDYLDYLEPEFEEYIKSLSSAEKCDVLGLEPEMPITLVTGVIGPRK